MYNVREMLKYLKTQESYQTKGMLSDFSIVGEEVDFWSAYRAAYSIYDSTFDRLYKSFVFFDQEEDETIAEVAARFTDAVKGLLTIYQKKYSELFRIEAIDDEHYSLTNNYDMSETMSKTIKFNKGSRTDNGGDTYGQHTDTVTGGAHTDTSTNKVAPYDSATFNNASQNDISYGSVSNSTQYGGYSDSNSFTSGAQEDNTTEGYTLTRIGNIGVMTATDMLAKHKDFWKDFTFMKDIFGDIAKELLRVGD